MKASELTYQRFGYPFAQTDAAMTPIADGDAEGARITFSDGFRESLAKREQKLVNRHDINAVMNLATKFSVYYQSVGMILYNAMVHDGTGLYQPSGLQRNTQCPVNALFPKVRDGGGFCYTVRVTADPSDATKGWVDIEQSGICPNHSKYIESVGDVNTYTATANCWVYFRSTCIPTYVVAVNGKTIGSHAQNIDSSLRYHGTNSVFMAMLLRKGDVFSTTAPSFVLRVRECG